jgi:phage terminase large subunit
MTNVLSRTDKIQLLKLLRQKDKDKIPPILYPLWKPCRKKMITGGRGSAKSETVCRITIRQASNYRLRVLWAREIMESIKESMWSMLSYLIPYLGYPGWDIKDEYIRNKKTGSYFAFKGLKDMRAARSMKGYAFFDRLIVDEAEAVPEDSWIMAVPTIRRPGSEIWAIFNRYEDLDPVYKLYCLQSDFQTITENGYSYQYNGSTMVIECNWTDNPWFPPELELEKNEMMKNDYELYLHVYENHPIAQLEFAIMERALVDIAMKTIFQPSGIQTLGVDPARHGMDKTKVYERRGPVAKKIIDRKHQSPVKTARELADKADDKWTVFNIDGAGLGAGGIIDLLKEWEFENVNEIKFNERPKDQKQYADTATEMYFECKEKLKTASIPNDPVLKQDLCGRKYGYDRNNKKKIEQKEDFRKRYHRSPDDGDACVLCFYDSGQKINMSGEDKNEMRKLVRERIIKNRKRWAGL